MRSHRIPVRGECAPSGSGAFLVSWEMNTGWGRAAGRSPFRRPVLPGGKATARERFPFPCEAERRRCPRSGDSGRKAERNGGKRPPETGVRRRPETPGAGRFPACFRFHRSGQTGTNRTIVKKRTKYGTAKTRMRSRSCFLPFFEVQHPLLLGRGGLSCRLPHGYSCPSRWP